MKATRKRIEVALPLAATNKASAREKSAGSTRVRARLRMRSNRRPQPDLWPTDTDR